MKLISVGFLKKVIDADDAKLKSQKRPLDQLNRALETRYNPFARPVHLTKKDPFSDPYFFQKVL